MVGLILNLSIYIFGLVAVAAATFFGAMQLEVHDNVTVNALQLLSPVVLWTQVVIYNYLFEGAELLVESVVDVCSEASLLKDRGGEVLVAFSFN